MFAAIAFFLLGVAWTLMLVHVFVIRPLRRELEKATDLTPWTFADTKSYLYGIYSRDVQ